MKEEEQIALLIRLDENMKNALKKLDSLDEKYVSYKEFLPVKSVTYGLVSLILFGVVGAILGLVLLKPTQSFFDTKKTETLQPQSSYGESPALLYDRMSVLPQD